jgi:hypothetical protein
MEAIIVNAKNKTELQLISDMLKKMRVGMRVLTIEEREDLGLIKLMKEADRTKTVSREKIMEKLGRK